MYRNTVYPITVPSNGTVADVVSTILESLTDYSFQNDTIKLLYKGKVINNNQTTHTATPIIEWGITTGSKLFLQASLKTDIEAILHHPQFRIRDDLVTTNNSSSSTVSSSSSSSSSPSSSSRPRIGGYGVATYGFGTIKVLELPGKENSRTLLNRIANDPGVRKLMEKRKFFVPELVEMYPGGSNGTKNVDPVCILGLNVNKGMAIHLRIRTDDLQGYIKYNTILKTVYHELAHNLISEHTGEFFALVSEFEREAEALDWTRSSGRTVGNNETVFRREYTNLRNNSSNTLPSSFAGGSGVTGYLPPHPNTDTESIIQSTAGREKLAQAALRRLQSESPDSSKDSSHSTSIHATNEPCEVCSNSGTGTANHQPTVSSIPSMAVGTGGYIGENPPVLMGTVEDEGTHVENVDVMMEEKEMHIAITESNNNTIFETMSNIDTRIKTPSELPHPSVPASTIEHNNITNDEPEFLDPALIAAQEAVRLRSQRMKDHLSQILKDCDLAKYSTKEKKEAFDLLNSIIEKALVAEGVWTSSTIVMDKTTDLTKYRRIRINNPIFQRKTVGSKGAIQFLMDCGFQQISLPSSGNNISTGSNTSITSTNEEWLSLLPLSIDIGSLYLGKEILQILLQELKDKE